MPLLLILCRYVSILQPERTSRPECLVFVISVPSGKISRLSQSQAELDPCVLPASAHAEQTSGSPLAPHFTQLSDKLKFQADAVVHRITFVKSVCFPPNHSIQKQRLPTQSET